MTNPAFIARGDRREGGELRPHQAQPDRHRHRDDGRRSRWPGAPAGRRWSATAPARPRTPRSPTSSWRWAPARSRPAPRPARERVAKYNRLLRIEEELGAGAGLPRLGGPRGRARRTCPRDLRALVAAPAGRPAGAAPSPAARRRAGRPGAPVTRWVDRGAIYAGWVGRRDGRHDRGQLPARHPDRADPVAPRPPGRPDHRLLRQRPLRTARPGRGAGSWPTAPTPAC